jgi:hypothetical protein
MTATVPQAIHLGSRPREAWHRVTAGRSRARFGVRGLPSRWRVAAEDSIELLALVWSIPLAMVVVGTPIALAVALLLWLGRVTLSAF